MAIDQAGHSSSGPSIRGSRRRGERGKSDEKHPTLAEYVAEPTAGYQAKRKGERITGDDKLGLRETRTERASNARNRHVDDRVVHDRHEDAGQHHDQRNLTPSAERFTHGGTQRHRARAQLVIGNDVARGSWRP